MLSWARFLLILRLVWIRACAGMTVGRGSSFSRHADEGRLHPLPLDGEG
jgi:hypothetical protein